MLNKVNGQINALFADFRPVENGGKGDTQSKRVKKRGDPQMLVEVAA